jgi:hypothetical protein
MGFPHVNHHRGIVVHKGDSLGRRHHLVASQGTVQDILQEKKEGNNETAGHQPVITDKFQQPIYGYIHGMFMGMLQG